MKSVSERDWRLFTKLHPVALDRFCRRVLEEARSILSTPQNDSHEQYVSLYKLLRTQDKELAKIFNDYRRSTAFLQIAMMYNHGLITEEELQQFSPETVSSIQSLREVFND